MAKGFTVKSAAAKAKKEAKTKELSMEEAMPKVYTELFKILKKDGNSGSYNYN